MPIHFIADLHLSSNNPELGEIFIDYLSHQARQADALFILGDLFEVWLGDDMILPEYQASLAAIRQLTESGTPVFIMYGNRDFLMRKDFETVTGCQLINDPTIIDLYGTPTMLMHGDTLCSDDVDYQAFRQQVRDSDWQEQLLSSTPEQRLALAQQYRETSKMQTGKKSAAIMDVNQQQVEQQMLKYQVTQLIHGHTHRPDTHHFTCNGHQLTRVVLSDWRQQGYVLICDESGCHEQVIQT